MPSFLFQSGRKTTLSLLLAIITILVFLPSLKISFFSDEIAFIERNQADDIQEALSLFDKKEYDGDYYRPIGNFVSGVITAIFKYNPIFYRLFNVLLHSLNVIIVFFFLYRLLKNSPKGNTIAFYSALAFGVFPLHDLAIIWHTDLFDRLMFLFYILSLTFYLRNYQTNPLSLLFFLLALMSKEMAFSLPLLIFTTHLILAGKNLLKSIRAALPYAALAVGFILFRLLAFNNNVFAIADSHTGKGLAVIAKNYILYTGLLVFPFPNDEIKSLIFEHQLIFLFVGAVLAGLLIYYLLKKKDNTLIFLLVFIIITLAPVSRLLMKWYLYLPSVGFTALLFYLLFTYGRNVKYILSVLVLVIYVLGILNLQFRWIDLTKKGEQIISEFKNDYLPDIREAEKIYLLTIPAEIEGKPVYHLQFDTYLEHILNIDDKIEVLSRSSLEGFDESINFKKLDSEYRLAHSKDNFFILFGYKNYYDVNEHDFENGKLKTLRFKKDSLADGKIFTFNLGQFLRIPNEVN